MLILQLHVVDLLFFLVSVLLVHSATDQTSLRSLHIPLICGLLFPTNSQLVLEGFLIGSDRLIRVEASVGPEDIQVTTGAVAVVTDIF